MKTKNNKIFQYSTINALVAGIFEGNLTVGELSEYGDLGLGTFNHLDGEMVGLDGVFYKVKAAEKPTVIRVSPDEKIPFGAVTHFNPNIPRIPSLGEPLDFKEFREYISRTIKPGNAFYAFRIEGHFDFIKTRSIPYQRGPTYPKLIKVVKYQAEYTFENIEGYLVGFWFPFYLKDINVPGYHFHFLSKDKTRGGHLFECRTGRFEIEAARIMEFQMILPDNPVFIKTDLSVSDEELAIIEGGQR